MPQTQTYIPINTHTCTHTLIYIDIYTYKHNCLLYYVTIKNLSLFTIGLEIYFSGKNALSSFNK